MNTERPVNIFRKVVSIILLLTVTSMCLSCTTEYADKRELDPKRISFESKYCDEPYKIQQSLNAYLKDGGYIFYKFEMKVTEDTIVSRGLKFNEARTDSVYVTKIPLNEVDRFEYVKGVKEEGNIVFQLVFGVILAYLLFSLFVVHLPDDIYPLS